MQARYENEVIRVSSDITDPEAFETAVYAAVTEQWPGFHATSSIRIGGDRVAVTLTCD